MHNPREQIFSTVVVTADGEAGSGKDALMNRLAARFFWAGVRNLRDDAGRPFRKASKATNLHLADYLGYATKHDLDADSDALQKGYLVGALGLIRWMAIYGDKVPQLYVFLTGRTFGHWTEQLFDKGSISLTAVLNLLVTCDPVVSAERIVKAKGVDRSDASFNDLKAAELENLMKRNVLDGERYSTRYHAKSMRDLLVRGVNKTKIDTTNLTLPQEEMIVISELSKRRMLAPGLFEDLRNSIANFPKISFVEPPGREDRSPQPDAGGIPGLA